MSEIKISFEDYTILVGYAFDQANDEQKDSVRAIVDRTTEMNR